MSYVVRKDSHEKMNFPVLSDTCWFPIFGNTENHIVESKLRPWLFIQFLEFKSQQ